MKSEQRIREVIVELDLRLSDPSTDPKIRAVYFERLFILRWVLDEVDQQ